MEGGADTLGFEEMRDEELALQLLEAEPYSHHSQNNDNED